MRRALLVVGCVFAVGLVAASWCRMKEVRAGSDTVTWEAEDSKADLEQPFRRRTGRKLDKKPKPQRNSGDGWIEIRDKANGDSKEGDGSDLPGVVRYKVNVKNAGQYKLYGRVLWPDGCGNSFFLRKAGRQRQILGEDGTYDSWHWVELQGPKLALAAGVNVIELLNREDGVLIDQLQVTTSSRIPTGEQRVTPGALAD